MQVNIKKLKKNIQMKRKRKKHYFFLFTGFIFSFFYFSFRGRLLHASATAITGFGIGKALLQKTALIQVLPILLLAMTLYGTYNFLLTFDRIGVLAGLFFAFLIVIISITVIRKKIIYLDQNVQKKVSLLQI